MNAPAKPPLADSPWFWAYVFGTCALIALALAAPKFSERQVQIEREFQGRQRAAQNLGGQQPNVEMSTVGNTQITLQPLFAGMAVITVGAWLVFWWSRRTNRNLEARE